MVDEHITIINAFDERGNLVTPAVISSRSVLQAAQAEMNRAKSLCEMYVLCRMKGLGATPMGTRATGPLIGKHPVVIHCTTTSCAFRDCIRVLDIPCFHRFHWKITGRSSLLIEVFGWPKHSGVVYTLVLSLAWRNPSRVLRVGWRLLVKEVRDW